MARKTSKLVYLRRVAYGCYALHVIMGLVGGGFLVAGLARKFGGSFAATAMGYLLGAEVVSIVAGLLGAIALLHFKPVMVKVSTFLTGCTLILMLSSVTFMYFKLVTVKEKIYLNLNTTMEHYGHYVTTYAEYKGDQHLDRMHARYECCGSSSVMSWKYTKYHKIPPSCCRKSTAQQCIQIQEQNLSFEAAYKAIAKIQKPIVALYDRGCLEPVTFWYHEAWLVITASGCVNAFLLFCAFIIVAVNGCVMRKSDL